MRRLIFTLILGLTPLTAHAERPMAPVTDADYAPVDQAEAKLGQLLFYDPVLSGNRNISCATCHHPDFATADGVSLSLGEGGIGLGPKRVVDPKNMPEDRIPRHSPALFNLGAHEFTTMFHDGRIEADPSKPGGLRTPMDADMTAGFVSVLSAQTMFPVLSQDEMAGHFSENEVSKAVRLGRITGPGGAWDLIAKRVAEIDEYKNKFNAVYPDIKAGKPIAFTDISNAIAAFIAFEWRSDTSPFDAYLKGTAALPKDAMAGLTLFYGDAGCATCHAGPFQTDHGFHAMGSPQFGPGKAAPFENHARDTGRMRVTGKQEDAYKFRTPSLRNVSQTAPYGHTGAFATLKTFIRAHIDPQPALTQYDRSNATLPAFDSEDWWVLDRPEEINAILSASRPPAVTLNETDMAQIIAFLKALDDPTALQGRLGIPDQVPSGLPVDR